MTIDERLERLTERHEALAQSVELMIAENRERDRQTAAGFAEIKTRFADVMEGIARLLHVAEIHEQRG